MPFTHLALVGLMGSGKSAVGEIVGARLGLPLVDVDDEITRRTGRSVRDLWEEGGEAAYRPLEQAIVLEALAPGPGKVLAAPGGVVVDPIAEEALPNPTSRSSTSVRPRRRSPSASERTTSPGPC